jgi:hypothetical protein
MVPPSSLSLELTRYIQFSAFLAQPLLDLDWARYSNVDRFLLDTFCTSELVDVDIKYPYCAIVAKLLEAPNGFWSQHIL